MIYAKPLSEIVRPTSLDDVVGNSHLLGKGSFFRRAIESGVLPNMILCGPSGVGKTTIATILSNMMDRQLYKINATNSNISDIKEIVSSSIFNSNGVIIQIDEIQYFNKKQQQCLLEYIENGQITLIATTTENPNFTIYNALLSRCFVFTLDMLSNSDIRCCIERILGGNFIKLNSISDEVMDYICSISNGDARRAINIIELISHGDVNLGDLSSLGSFAPMKYDKSSDYHYDILSAFQKSIRGSDANASIHYLARLVEVGDILSICRRLLVIACEDIGLAYPGAISIVKSCVDAAMQLGFPEARIPLSEATILLATSPKSNTAVLAIDSAICDIKNGMIGEIPNYLKSNVSTANESLGYKYPHNYNNNYIKQDYLPGELSGREYYIYGDNKQEQIAKRYWDNIKV